MFVYSFPQQWKNLIYTVSVCGLIVGTLVSNIARSLSPPIPNYLGNALAD